jgi:pimeloyl-ACP methyl ester carboxylesterase
VKVEDVQFHSGNLTLRGELYLPDPSRSSGILICHAMHAQGFRWLPLYRMFAGQAAEYGFTCLLFDFRGCGRSEGKFDYGWGEQLDAKAALEFLLSQKQVDPTSAFVVGRSLGGTVALYSSIDDPRVKGYALWATPPDHHWNIKNFIEKTRGKPGYLMFLLLSTLDRFWNVTRIMKVDLWGLNMRPKDVRSKLMTLSGSRLVSRKKHPPILLLWGAEDDYVSFSEEKSYEDSIPGEKRLIILEKTGHTFKGAEEQVASLTLDWFQKLQEKD